MGIPLILCVSLYCAFNYFYKPHTTEPQRVEQSVIAPQVKQTTETKTTVSYVPKQITNGIKEDTDVETVIEQPKVSVKVNGKEHKFDLQQTETQKFEDGKVVLNQTSEVVFDVKIPDRHELIVYAQEEVRGGKLHHELGVEKKNGNFHYGGKYDFKDKEWAGYVRYDVKKVYTN